MNCYVKKISTSVVPFNNIEICVLGESMLLCFPASCPNKMIWFENADGTKCWEDITSKEEVKISLGNLRDNFYYVNIFLDYENDNNYECYIYGKEVVAKVKNGNMMLKICPYYFWNQNLLNNIEKLYAYTSPLVESEFEVRDLAKTITKRAKDKYECIFLIHEWVAEHLFYDYDSLKVPNRQYLSISEILKTRKCVCQGYADLSMALLSSIGITAENILCRALDDTRKDGWSNPTNRSADLNHVITRAYTGKRWVLMDVTWDSANRYEDKK